jgi:hypothetical protein
VVGTGLAFLIHLRNIRLGGASAASLVTYLVPLVAVVVGMLVLGERLTWYQPVGALIVLAGVTVSQGLPGRRRRVPQEAQNTSDPRTGAPHDGQAFIGSSITRARRTVRQRAGFSSTRPTCAVLQLQYNATKAID